jgi:tRNA threonylcarbamoyl adenosine modification protein (Sua5/YciO/YrdC/YwlC family)
VSLRYTCADASVRARGLTRAAQVLAEHKLVVLPADTVYGIAADAFSTEGVRALHRARGVGSAGPPPPVLVPRPRTLDGLATRVSPQVRALAESFWPGPLSLLCAAQPTLDWGLGSATVLLRMPLHPVALELLDRTGPLAVTGASPPRQPQALTVDDAEHHFADVVEVYLDAGAMPGGLASTVVDGTADVPRVLREGALSMDELRDVVPDLLGPGGEQ